ncbi:MAG TPA: hypothetical protein VIB79_09820 [Candidatus Binatia bacterium]|jgi:hypothetical protein
MSYDEAIGAVSIFLVELSKVETNRRVWLIIAVVSLALYLRRKLATGIQTLPAIAWMPIVSRLLSNWVKSHDYTEEEFLRGDGAPQSAVEIRKEGLDRLAKSLQERYGRSIAWANSIREGFSDLRFTDANRVPFPFVRVMRGAREKAPAREKSRDGSELDQRTIETGK